MSSQTHRLIMTLGLFFGWLLSGPFNGPVWAAFLLSEKYTGPNLVMIFSIAHFLTLFIGGAVFKSDRYWAALMIWGSVFTLLLNALLPLAAPAVWAFLAALSGLSSALFTLGWSFPFAMGLDPDTRLKTMCIIIINANVILAVLTLSANYLPPEIAYHLANVFLLLVCWRILPLSNQRYQAPPDKPARLHFQTLPPAFMLILGLFIFGIYINGGFMYRVMYPSYSEYGELAQYYRLIPYICVLLIIWRYGQDINRSLPIYLGTSLLGLAFISFSLLADFSIVGYLFTETLVQSAFAILDVFLFTLLGDIALFYPPAGKIFGYGLAANVGAIITGDILGIRLFHLAENLRMTTSLFASAAIFLAFLIYPWLNDRISRVFYNTGPQEESVNESAATEDAEDSSPSQVLLVSHSDITDNLTPREIEIMGHILQGSTNKSIAATLFISESTLKTHIRNIYHKTGVTHKRELIAKALLEKNTAQE